MTNPGRILIGPAGADPSNLAAFRDVGYTTSDSDGLAADPAHRPPLTLDLTGAVASLGRAETALRSFAAALGRTRLGRMVAALHAPTHRGYLRAVRRGTATTRAIGRRDARRVPARSTHLRRIRTAYRNRK